MPIYAAIPFVLMLLSIAIIPLINNVWWQNNLVKICLLLSIPVAVAVLFINYTWLVHTALEYISFITLLGSLFIISGGILLKENLRISPTVNTCVLLIGAILANLIGTTGAAMLLIRPLISLNKERKNRSHLIIFFIFIVANIGGSLTPLGDPPLFLGFLQGVPFTWTLKLLPAWLLNNSILLLLFLIIDSVLLKKEKIKQKTSKTGPLVVVAGKRNFIFLLGVVLSLFINTEYKNIIQILLMTFMAILSWIYTPKKYRLENDFCWEPIKEVAILFAAIFTTMIPLLKLLEIKGSGLNITEPYQFFWVTGSLSSFLDNAPTYLAMLSLGKTMTHHINSVSLIDGFFIREHILLAISMGAVFMGANTYIGNGPNFMIRSIAVERGIKMPSFFMYMLWAIIILIPIFILDTIIFFM